MPRYFFNVMDATYIPDEFGTELPDLDAARQNALRYASGLLSDRAFSLALHDGWHMDVTDEHGLVLFYLDFSTGDAPALLNEDAAAVALKGKPLPE